MNITLKKEEIRGKRRHKTRCQTQRGENKRTAGEKFREGKIATKGKKEENSGMEKITRGKKRTEKKKKKKNDPKQGFCRISKKELLGGGKSNVLLWNPRKRGKQTASTKDAILY